MTKLALESGAEIINGERKVRMGVQHKKDLPPLGKIINARVEESDGHYYLVAEQFEYDTYEDVSWNKDLVKASSSVDNHPFNEPDFDVPEKLEITVDRQNFKNYSDFESYLTFVESIHSEVQTGEFGRKAQINDPEIVLKLTEYFLVYKLLKPALEKTAKKISEKVSDKLTVESEKLYDFIRKSLKEFLLRVIPKNRPVSYVIKLAGKPEIELFAKITDPEMLIRALKQNKLEKLRDEIQAINVNVDFEKIQFILTEKGKWKFNFLLTEKGETIGRKVSFKKRDKMLELVTKKTKARKK